jgi:PAS domain S-box-containing protein
VTPSPSDRARRILDLLRTTEGVDALEAAITRELSEAASAARETAAAERALRASGDELTERILEAVPGGVVVVSTSGAVFKANAEAQRVLGLSFDALTRRFVSDFGPETFREDGSVCPVEDYPVSRCLATGEPQPAMLIGVRQPRGALAWAYFRAEPLRAPDGALAGAVVTFVDVSARLRAEAELRRSEERFRMLVESSPDHILVVDRDGRIGFLNRVAPSFAMHEVVGRTCFELSRPEDHAALHAALEAIFEAGKPSTSWEGSDTRGRIYECSMIPLRDPDGSVTQAMMITTDVTERRRSEEERRHLDRSLMQAQRLGSLSLFAGGVAHDFNNMLVGIRGNIELALQRLGPSSPARQVLDDARRATHHASELTSQLLAYSGRREHAAEPVDLNALTEEMTQLLRATTANRAAVKLELAPELPTAEGDATQVRQVLMNLLTNATESLGGEPGAVTVRTSVAGAEDVRAWSNALAPGEPVAARYVVLEVHDDGCGMDAETRARVFDPFFTTKVTGRGLGLAAALGIVRGHRGAIGVESAPGAGSTFRVAVPARDAAPPTAPAAAPAAAHAPRPAAPIPAAERPLVLVVDDEKHVRSVARIALEEGGFRVLTAEDGRGALDLFTANAPAVRAVVLDLLMPDMGGAEALLALRQIREDVPVILSSGFGEDTATQRLEGLAGFLRKPYHLDELVALVQRVAR